jgi:hypothetical protein
MSLTIWKGPTNALVAAPDTGGLVASDRIRFTSNFWGTYSLCLANAVARGTFGAGAYAGYVVNQCTVTQQRGGIGRLVIEWEAGGSYAVNPLPVGSHSLAPQELYPKIERNSYFQGTSGVSGAPTTPIESNTIQLADPIALDKSQRMVEAREEAVTLNQRKKTESLEASVQRNERQRDAKEWECYDLEMESYQRGIFEREKPIPPNFPRPSDDDDVAAMQPRPSRGEQAKIVTDFVTTP